MSQPPASLLNTNMQLGPGVGLRKHMTDQLTFSFHTYSAYGFCITNVGQTPIEVSWSWIVNATFKGTDEFMGFPVNIWIYKVCE